MIRDNVTVVLLGMGGAVYVLAIILAGAVGHVADLLAAEAYPVYNCDEVAAYLQASGMAAADVQRAVDGLAYNGECIPGEVAGEVMDISDMTFEADTSIDEMMMDTDVYPVQ